MKQNRQASHAVLAALLTAVLLLSGTVLSVAAEPAALGKKDGSYTVTLELKGGDPNASVAEPVFLRVNDGKGYATVEWQNVKYDALILDGETYHPVDAEETTFELPVTVYDKAMDVTAVSDGEKTEYALLFSGSGIHKVRTPKDYLIVVAAMFAVFLAAVLVSIRRMKNQ